MAEQKDRKIMFPVFFVFCSRIPRGGCSGNPDNRRQMVGFLPSNLSENIRLPRCRYTVLIMPIVSAFGRPAFAVTEVCSVGEICISVPDNDIFPLDFRAFVVHNPYIGCEERVMGNLRYTGSDDDTFQIAIFKGKSPHTCYTVAYYYVCQIIAPKESTGTYVRHIVRYNDTC